MSRTVEQIIDEVIKVDGGFKDDPRDAGGATCWGITQAVARGAGYTGDMRFPWSRL